MKAGFGGAKVNSRARSLKRQKTLEYHGRVLRRSLLFHSLKAILMDDFMLQDIGTQHINTKESTHGTV